MSFNMWLQDGVPFSAFFGDAPSLKRHPKNMFSTCGFKMGCPFQLSLGMLQASKGTPKTCFQHVASRWYTLFSFLCGCKNQKGHCENVSFNMRLRDGALFSFLWGCMKPQKGHPRNIAKLMKSGNDATQCCRNSPQISSLTFGVSSAFSSEMLRWLRLFDTDGHDPALTRRPRHDLFERTGLPKTLLYKSI